MFIPYTPPSAKKDSSQRRAINAFVAANAGARRRGRTKDKVGESVYSLDERPVVISHQRQDDANEDADQDASKDANEDANEGANQAHVPARNERPALEWPISTGLHYPAPEKDYYPTLLVERQQLSIIVANQYPGTFVNQIYTSWTQRVMSDSCLFHATLFATSSFLDIMERREDNPVTHYHKYETIRLVQQAISNSDSAGLSEMDIVATTYLVYFAKLNGSLEEAKCHDAGLDAMIRFKGPSTLTPDTYTGYLLRLRLVWNSIFYQMDTIYTSPLAGPKPALGHHTDLLAIAVQKQLERSPTLRLPESIIQCLLAFHNRSIQAAGPCEWPEVAPLQDQPPVDPDVSNALECCSLAAKIWCRAVTKDHTYRKAQNLDDLEKLKMAALQVKPLFWLRRGPEVLRWILMTGAAAAGRKSDQALFITRCYLLTAIVTPGELNEFMVAVNHLLWLFNHPV
ncbi:hypothetical protein BJX99DRAFT_104448 [Aspergillus californicus]